MSDVAKANYKEIQLSQYALKHLRTKDAREYAQKLIEDHTKLNEDLAKLAASKNVTLPDSAALSTMFAKGELELTSKKKFDTEFLDKMATEHTAAISVFQNE